MKLANLSATTALFVTLFSATGNAQFGQMEPVEPAVSETFVQELDFSTRVIRIDISHFSEVQVRTANTRNATVAVEVLAPQSRPQRLKQLLSFIEFVQSNDREMIRVRANIPSYSCSLQQFNVNGNLSRKVGGSCFGRAIVTLPAGAPIAVFNGSTPLTASANNIVNSEPLLGKVLKESFDDNKIKVINESFAKNPTLRLSPQDGAQIVQAITFSSNKKSVAITIGSRIPRSLRLEYYGLIEDKLGHFDKQDVLQKLSSMP